MTKLRLRGPFVPAMLNTRDEFIAPFSSLFDQLVDQHFPEFKENFGIQFSKGSYPKVDVIDYADKLEIVAEIAGWKKDDINIEIEKGILTISGNTQTDKESPVLNYIVKELKRSSFQRSFQLGEKLDDTRISASFNDGILLIEIPKRDTEPVISKKVIDIKKRID